VKTLTVIVLHWNGYADTAALLPTLARCRVPEGWRARVLVVDNGSTDGSGARLAAEFPEIELLSLDSNRMFAGGNNAGLRLALERGDDAIMLLNNDTEADPGLYERLLLALAQNPGAGAVAPLIYYAPPGDAIWFAGAVCIPALGFTAHRGIRSRDHGQYREIETSGYLTGCCLLAPSEVWKRVGLLDESYFIYAEDADWSLRARAAGYALLFVPTARLWHKVSSSSGGASNPWKTYHVLRANMRLFSNHARGIARVTWFPAFLAQQVLLVSWLLLRGRLAVARVVLRGLWHALRGTPAAELRP
jgi:GT2 family glycosyltransferase